MRYFIVLIFVFASKLTYSQENEEFVSKSFTVIITTKKYGSALKKAQKAANDLQIPMDLRGLSANKENGLWTSEVCGCGEQHGYIPRGRFDDGKYISIEYSTAFERLKPGYYIVVVQSGDRTELEQSFLPILKIYNDAYLINNPVYLGCMH